MCRLCDEGKLQNHDDAGSPQNRDDEGKPPGYFGSRRDFLKAATATGVAAGGAGLFAAGPAAAHGGGPPEDHGRRKRRYVIRGGSVMSMDPSVGDLDQGDVLIEGKKILAVGQNLHAGDAGEIDARGKIVMPGFIDTHHHLFETALRSFLANGILINDSSGSVSSNPTYFEYILGKFAPVYRPQDVYISELFGGLAQLAGGVTTCHDISQIHHSRDHSDAAIQALFDTRRRAALGYFESAGGVAGNEYPQDAFRIKKQWFSSSDQLVHMIMGGEVYLGEPTYTQAWQIGRQLGLQVAAHILSPFGIRPILDDLAAGTGGVNNNIGLDSDNLFIHMTGMSDFGWQKVKEKGVQVSIAFPIEMNMRHGIPPMLKMQALGMEPSLSSDVEVTMTADFFTQMRSAMTMQRMVVNQMILEQGTFLPPFLDQWPIPGGDKPPLLTVRDVLRFATINGAKHLRLDGKTGSLKPGKEADIIILDATAPNVAPLNSVPGAVVSLMDTSNVETVIVAGKIRKWKGQLLDVDMRHLRRQLERSRDYLFGAAKVDRKLYPD
jgi:cytosine/adenosine deaminase-related metal-dependent hydrolase